jgi:exonuclease SbcC
MIPKRVKLKGFLCYKDEQEISFDGASLWMLAGLNGSGKSSVFDAVTYALFGHHRGGSQDAHELINKDSDRALVEFDFAIDGHCFQAYRTIQLTKQGKAKGTQQIFLRAADGTKDAVPGTTLKAGYDEWVQENLGLSYETFTSSVLLLQGKADKLLDSTAKGRHEVLAGIVDLERYRRLHQRADEERKANEGELKSLHNRLTALPEVSAADLAAANERIAAADAARQQAQAEVDRLQGLEFQARQWQELQARLDTARRRWEQAQGLIGDAAAIEADVQRLRELRDVLPRVQTIHQQQSQIRNSEIQTKELTNQKQQLEAKRDHQDNLLKEARTKRANLQNQVIADEQRHRDLRNRLRQAGALLEKLKEYERQEEGRYRLQAELARLPADPAGVLTKAREECDRLAALHQALPVLNRFRSQREELQQVRVREKAAQEARQAVQARGEQFAADVERLRPKVEGASNDRQAADEKATRAQTLLDQARRQVVELGELHGAKVCRHCGQALTPEHLRDEKRRRERVVTAAKEEYRQATTVQQASRKAETELRDQFTRFEKQLLEARYEFRDHRHRAEQARQDVERLQRDCGLTYQELSEPFRSRVSPAPPADWQETSFPTAADLDLVRTQAECLGAARLALRQAEQVQFQWSTLQGQEASARQSLARLQAELPADRAQVRQEHVRLEAEEQALDKTLAARRTEVVATQEQLDRLSRERDQTQQQLAALQGQLTTQEATRLLCRQTLAQARKDLPGPWQALADRAGLAELHAWGSERDELVRRQTDERGRQLQEARAGLEVLRQDHCDLEARAAQVPTEARHEPAHFQALGQEARQACRARDDELVQARQHKGQLESYRRQRDQLEQDIMRAEKTHFHAKVLADLLGRDRLQLHLVRQAERQVVDYANAVLDRLSGGQLYLKLVGEAGGDGNAAKALELETHNRSTGEKPINVAFLSGSQKFRVAVSLALGIGQYASRRHRPIESVIIDEGFGCLDKEGRQAMIQEMQNLRDQLKCILLVSHQEEFADAFADGYFFELKGKTTKATRFQR